MFVIKSRVREELVTKSIGRALPLRIRERGIPPNDHEHIFERHFRGIQENSHIAGTGLGLAIVKELIERMEGKIDLISPNGLSDNAIYPGTTMIIWLAEATENLLQP